MHQIIIIKYLKEVEKKKDEKIANKRRILLSMECLSQNGVPESNKKKLKNDQKPTCENCVLREKFKLMLMVYLMLTACLSAALNMHIGKATCFERSNINCIIFYYYYY